MSLHGSVSGWIAQVKLGRQSAAARLWERYSPRLTQLARVRLNGIACRVADEEDVVLAAFQSFLRRIKEGSYPRLRDRGELWRLLVTITSHKALNVIREERSCKRGGGNVLNDPLLPDTYSVVHETLVNLASSEPSPQLVVMVADSLEHLLSHLRDDELRHIAMAKLCGQPNEEIAREIQRSVPTVERRVRLIRDAWRQELAD